MGEDERGLHRKAMAAFGGIAPSYHIELLDKPTSYWDFHSLLLGIQMMFSFMLVDSDQPLRLCKHCQKVFLGSRSNAAFCSPRCKESVQCLQEPFLKMTKKIKSNEGGIVIMEILKLREHGELAAKAASWFHSKWHIPVEEYTKSIRNV